MANNHKWPIRAWHSLSTPPIPARASDGALVWDDAFGNIGSFHWQFSDQTIYTAVQSLGVCLGGEGWGGNVEGGGEMCGIVWEHVGTSKEGERL